MTTDKATISAWEEGLVLQVIRDSGLLSIAGADLASLFRDLLTPERLDQHLHTLQLAGRVQYDLQHAKWWAWPETAT